MPPQSASDLKRFTPASYEGREGAPVYLIASLTWRERARYRQALYSQGVRFPINRDFSAAARELLRALAPENEAELQGAIDAWEELEAAEALVPPAEDAQEDDRLAFETEMARRLTVARAYDALMDQLRPCPQIGRLFGERVGYNQMAPGIAASFALRGWENIATPFRRRDGVVPDDVLESVAADLVAIGTEAITLMHLSEAQRGN